MRRQHVDAVRHAQRVATRLTRDAKQRGRLAIAGDEADPVFATERDCGDIAHAQATADRDTGDVIRRPCLGLRDDEVLLVVARDAAHRIDRRGLTNGRGEIVVRQARLREARRISDHLEFAHDAPLHIDATDTGHAREDRPDAIPGDVIERRRITAFEVVTDDRKHRRRESLDLQVDSSGQVATDAVDPRLHQLQRHLHDHRRGKGDVDLAATANRARLHARDTGHDADRFFDRSGDAEDLLSRTECRPLRDHRDARKFELGIDRGRDTRRRPHPGGGRQRHRQQHESLLRREHGEHAAARHRVAWCAHGFGTTIRTPSSI